MSSFSCIPFGQHALLVQFEQKIDPITLRHVMALEQLIKAHLPKGIEELIPAYASLAVLFDRKQWTHKKLAKTIRDLDALLSRAVQHLPKGRTHEIPVHYGGSHGPDLTAVARQLGMKEEEIVRRHSRKKYLVYMLGFLPGFVYLGKLDPMLQLTRRAKPRLRVAAGSIAIAGKQTGIYTLESPGGWHLIGQTTSNLFKIPQAQESPSVLRRGDWVKFIPVSSRSNF